MSSPHITSLDIVLNELSFEPPTEKIYDAWPWMRSLVETLHDYIAVEPTEIKTLLVPADMMSIPLAEGYTIHSWCEDRQVPDVDRTFLLGLSTQKPFLDRDRMECHFQGHFGAGLTVAWRDSFPVASVHSTDCWDATHLDVDTTTLNEAEDDYASHRGQVCHACRADHVRSHVGWMRERIRDIQAQRKTLFRSGTELWNKREAAFPYLTLGNDVLRQLRSIRNGDERVHSIARRLFELDRYCASWHEGPFDTHVCPGNPRQEGAVALQKYAEQRMFDIPNREKRLFSWHVSAYIDGWRVYFEPIAVAERPGYGSKRMVIGYVGPHLDTKKFS